MVSRLVCSLLSALCSAWGFLNSGMGLITMRLVKYLQRETTMANYIQSILTRLLRRFARQEKRQMAKQWNMRAATFLMKSSTMSYMMKMALKERPHGQSWNRQWGMYLARPLQRYFTFAWPQETAKNDYRSSTSSLILNRSSLKISRIKVGWLRTSVRPSTVPSWPLTAKDWNWLRESNDEGWKINLSECILIWRAGCIIQSEFIADLLELFLKENKSFTNMDFNCFIGRELHCSYSALEPIVFRGIIADH